MVHRYKATIQGNKIFMREYEVKESSSLYAFHTFLQNDLGFSPDQMVIFRALNNNGKVVKEFGLFDLGDGAMDRVTLESLGRSNLTNLEYVYDMFKDRAISLELLSKGELMPKRSYPRLIAERGKNPDQFSDNYDDFEQLMDGTPEQDLTQEDAAGLYSSEEV
ncbi:MAG: hypothetical protein EOM16_01345 [Bacteroidia bacterium]|jgi:hypothetical protein|nr:hypothetical protein [Bacteroidales bacterium]MDD3299596.1 hypothetical protein [Bacteroidales bacterium]MDD3844270.1 hypothetical protein [Bacteroidales bacterium]MDD4618808.1 hypothetical protein [Bacteroidales bacterium]NCC45665.1 hypothetical protein [Bacteroidia bacterium]